MCGAMTPHAVSTDAAQLAEIRREVTAALTKFLARQRAAFAEIGDDMLAPLDAAAGLLAGGKRLRPAFCYWGWRAAGGADCPEIYTAAAALELLQASALIHDDVMDASDTRRGQPAVHRQFARRQELTGGPGAAQFGDGAAIVIGDMLLSWTNQLYHASGFPAGILARGLPAFDAMQTEVAAGQYLDILSQARVATSVAEALRVITFKTTKYTIERPLQLGASLAAEQYPSLSSYARPLGVAFQLRDDVLGVFGDPEQTGKPVTGDISEGKRTVLIALARQSASTSQQAVLDRYLGDRSLTPAGAGEVRAVIAQTGALAQCEAMIAASVTDALAALTEARITAEARDALAALAVTATDRSG